MMSSARLVAVIFGLAVALALAVVAAHPRVRALERRLGLTVLLSTGVPFIGLGAILHWHRVGILTDSILTDLRPAYDFGLGWIGFVVGMRFDIRRLDQLPGYLGTVIVIETVVPMAVAAILCGGTLIFLSDGGGWMLLHQVLILMACAAASGPVSAEYMTRVCGPKMAWMLERITKIDEIAALCLLGLVAIVFRPVQAVAGTVWVLPPSAWLLVSLGLGTLLGVITYILIRGATSPAEQLSLLLGAVALSAGMAGYLALSVPVICAVAGALLANLPTPNRVAQEKMLLDLERPLYLVFLLLAGALWRPDEWQGWVLALPFVVARVIGKLLGAALSRRANPSLPPTPVLALALLPQSPIAIVVIASAAVLPGVEREFVRWAINAVVVGGVFTESIVRLLQRFTLFQEPSQGPGQAVENLPHEGRGL